MAPDPLASLDDSAESDADPFNEDRVMAIATEAIPADADFDDPLAQGTASDDSAATERQVTAARTALSRTVSRVTAATDDDDPLLAGDAAAPRSDGAPAPQSMNAVAAINRGLMTLTLAADLPDAVRKAAPALGEAGLARGLVVALTHGSPRAICSWEMTATGPQVRKDGLGSFLTPGLNVALTRLFAGWTPLGDGVRADNLKPFHRWVDRDHKLMATSVPIATGKQLVVIAAWHASTRDDPVVRAAAMELCRRLAHVTT